jgi:hypothetical protein
MMRKLLASIVMFCGAGSALAFPNTANYCSDGFDKPARLSIRDRALS